jgi:hypothetical protein
VDPGLVAAAAAELSANPAALGLLEAALTDAFDRRAGDGFGRGDLVAAGGLAGVVCRRAEAAAAALDDPETVRKILLRLVEAGGDTVGRRLARIDELYELGLPADAVAAVLDAFATSRLVTLDGEPSPGASTVEIVHAALVTEWDQLRAWIDDAGLQWAAHSRLVESAAEWVRGGRRSDDLASGDRLASFVEHLAATDLPVSVTERDFVSAGRSVRRRRQAVARTRDAGAAAALISRVVPGSGDEAVAEAELPPPLTEMPEGDELAVDVPVDADDTEPADEAVDVVAFADPLPDPLPDPLLDDAYVDQDVLDFDEEADDLDDDLD